jgi:hypothetical protein
VSAGALKARDHIRAGEVGTERDKFKPLLPSTGRSRLALLLFWAPAAQID